MAVRLLRLDPRLHRPDGDRQSRIEAPAAFHVANNVLLSIVNTLMADGEPFALDRSTDTGDASLPLLAGVNLAMVALVRVRERRAGPVVGDELASSRTCQRP